MTSHKLLFRAVVGSQSYGTSTPASDIDYKGIYSQPISDLITFNYKEQIEIGKDETLYEVQRFLQLIQSANPTVLELLFSPKDCVLTSSPQYDLLYGVRDRFLTKQCANSFGGYAIAQIKKARGLDKKMNFEKSRVERKGPLDFCYVYLSEEGKTAPISHWLKVNDMRQELCGLVRLDHFKDCYALHYDFQAQYGKDARSRPVDPIGYRGIVGEDSNELRLSSIPKYSKPQAIIYYNKDGYSVHCKDYKEYQDWLNNRNTSRYVDTVTHGQKIDGKNLMHCRRLLDMAMEIATEGVINVRRPNADYLLKIRRGEVALDTIINKAEEDIKDMDRIFTECSLPDAVDPIWVNGLLLQIRTM